MIEKRNTVTLVEGPDAAGKSTLIARLASSNADVDHFHNGPYKNLGSDALFDVYLGQLIDTMRGGHNAFLDRGWVSERIYGSVMRNGIRLTRNHIRMLERVALGLSGVLALVLPDHDLVMDRFYRKLKTRYEYLNTGDSNEAMDRVDKVYQAFEAMTNVAPDLLSIPSASALPAVVLRHEEFPSTRSAEISRLRQRIEIARWRNWGPGIGAWRPDESTLIVGEMQNRYGLELPFVSTRGCSMWLADQLEMAGIGEDRLYWVNALYRNGFNRLDPSFLATLRPRRVVALGEVAADWCENDATKYLSRYVHIPHPQYWKRFKHDQPYPIKEAFNDES